MVKLKCKHGSGEQIQGHSRGDMGGGQPHPPSPPLSLDHLRVLGSVASSNSRRTWSRFPEHHGPWAETGKKRQGQVAAGPGGGFEAPTRAAAAAGPGGGFEAPARAAAPTGPTPGPALQELGRGLRLAPRCLPTSLPRPPPPFQKLSDLSGGQAWLEEAQEAMCSLGRSPPKSGLRRLLFTERTAGARKWGRAQQPVPPPPQAVAPHRALQLGGSWVGLRCPHPALCAHRQSPGDRGTNSLKSGNGGGVLATSAGCQRLGKKAAEGQGHRAPGPAATGAL